MQMILSDIVSNIINRRIPAVEGGYLELLKPYDWRGILTEHLRTMSDDVFISLAMREYNQEVEPSVYLIHEETGMFQIVINIFNMERFNRLISDKKIGPHNHRFSFASRIINGGYFQWIYKSIYVYSLDSLRFRCQRLCGVDTVYKFPSDEFHFVTRLIEDDTLSVMIRSPAPPPPHVVHGVEWGRHFAAERMRLIRVLSRAATQRPGIALDLRADG
jgi:hypothetical protein